MNHNDPRLSSCPFTLVSFTAPVYKPRSNLQRNFRNHIPRISTLLTLDFPPRNGQPHDTNNAGENSRGVEIPKVLVLRPLRPCKSWAGLPKQVIRQRRLRTGAGSPWPWVDIANDRLKKSVRFREKKFEQRIEGLKLYAEGDKKPSPSSLVFELGCGKYMGRRLSVRSLRQSTPPG